MGILSFFLVEKNYKKMSDEKNFKMTPEEEEKMSAALKKPEFREMLFDYVKEIQDPANRATYEADLAKYEQQVAAETREEKEKAVESNIARPVVKESHSLKPQQKEQQPAAKSKSTITGNRRQISSTRDDIF